VPLSRCLTPSQSSAEKPPRALISSKRKSSARGNVGAELNCPSVSVSHSHGQAQRTAAQFSFKNKALTLSAKQPSSKHLLTRTRPCGQPPNLLELPVTAPRLQAARAAAHPRRSEPAERRRCPLLDVRRAVGVGLQRVHDLVVVQKQLHEEVLPLRAHRRSLYWLHQLQLQ